eukprot:802555-Rhodomonas_salina.2
MRCPVLTWAILLPCYAFSTRCPVLTSGMVLPGTAGWKASRAIASEQRVASVLRARYAMSGTENGFSVPCPGLRKASIRCSNGSNTRCPLVRSGVPLADGTRRKSSAKR